MPTAGSEVLGRVAIRVEKHRRRRLTDRRVNGPRSMENPATVARRLLCIYQHAPTPGAPGIYRHRLYLAELVRRGWHVDLISTPINYMRGTVPEAVQVFIAPPSLDALRTRLIGRGTDDEDEVAARLRVAESELAAQNEFGHVVVNDRLEDAADRLVAIVASALQGPVKSA